VLHLEGEGKSEHKIERVREKSQQNRSQKAGTRTSHAHLAHWSRTPALHGRVWLTAHTNFVLLARAILQAAHVIRYY
jgi:hypothetical protein